MRDTLIISLITLGISSLTFVAYKHPKGYERLYKPLCIITFAVLALFAVYNIGYTYGFTRASKEYLTLNAQVMLKNP